MVFAMIKASPDQKEAAKGLMHGEDTFLTGGAGTGKSFVLNSFLQHSPGKFLRTATTGAAATLIKGATLHSVAGLPTSVYKPESMKELDDKVAARFRGVSGITVDECSMLRIDAFQALLDVLHLVREKHRLKPQLIMTGDFAQLPPVITDKEKDVFSHYYGDKTFAFEHPEWARLRVRSLTTMHRQGGDLEFASWLSRIRAGGVPDVGFINQFVNPGRKPHSVRLVATNDAAARINNDERDELDGNDEFVFEGQVFGAFDQQSMRVPPKMTLPAGSRVIICANDRSGERAYVNGTTGTLIRKTKNDEAVIETDGGKEVIVPPNKWDQVRYEPVKDDGQIIGFESVVNAYYRQTPILPGWAITIHRSQGMSLNDVHVDARGVFAPGQTYVALSRATSTAGLTLEHPLLPEDIIHDDKVRAYHRRVL